MLTPVTIIQNYRAAVESALKNLLEQKHLYQSVHVDLDRLKQTIGKSEPHVPDRRAPVGRTIQLTQEDRAAIVKRHQSELLGCVSMLSQSTWGLTVHDAKKPRSANPSNPEGEPVCYLPTICRGCHSCSAINPPHNPGYFTSGKEEPLLDVVLPRNGHKPTVQIWAVAYQCQACRGEPVIYEIRRDGEKLQLVGRSTFDRVSVPKFFPKHLHRFYSETQIARTAGKPLAGCLYLRLLIEHHIRAVADAGEKATGDELADAYSPCLHPEFPRSKVSLREAYGSLSEVIHSGKEDAETLDAQLAKVEEHFRLLELLPLTPQKSASVKEDDEIDF